MSVDEILNSLEDPCASSSRRMDLYDALSHHTDDNRAWIRLLRAVEEEQDPAVVDFVVKAALRPFKAQHATLVPRLVERFSADSEGLPCTRLTDAVRHWVKVLPSSALFSVPGTLCARLGWDTTPPKAPLAERLEAALDALAAGDAMPFLRWRALDVPPTMARRKRLLEKVERRVVQLYNGADPERRLLAVETLSMLGASAGMLRELCAPLPRTSGIVDLAEAVPALRISPVRQLGAGAIETIADTAWLVGQGITPASTVHEGSLHQADVWKVGPVLALREGGFLYAFVERTDARAKHATPTLRLTILRLADRRVTIETSLPASGVESFAVAGRHIVVGGRSLRAFHGGRQVWEIEPPDDRQEFRALTATGDDEHVFACVGDELICLEANSGAERWRSTAAFPFQNANPALATSPHGLYVLTGKGVVLLDMANGAAQDVVSADFGQGFLSVDGDVWLWDGTSCLGEPIVSGLSLGTRQWRAASRLGHSVTRTVNGTTVLLSGTAARWEGGGGAIDWPLGIGIGGVGPAHDGMILLGAGAIVPMPWAWFELPISR